MLDKFFLRFEATNNLGYEEGKHIAYRTVDAVGSLVQKDSNAASSFAIDVDNAALPRRCPVITFHVNDIADKLAHADGNTGKGIDESFDRVLGALLTAGVPWYLALK